MSCERCDQWLQDVLDGVEPDVVLVEHLASCAACRDLYESAATLAQSLRRMPRPAPVEELADRIVSAVLFDRKRRQRRRQTVARVAALAAAILLAWFVAGSWPQPRPEPGPPVAVRPEAEPLPSLRQAVVTAGSAAVDRARRQMGEAVDSTL